ncbi:hypothetical protein [Candidatus Odyssella acanthamoebae]|uniref:Lipoprotein n=1 Tax=Candidatus Odyssella acanthamoebae TaxID=91604 RepID=A0A077AVC9_9PROT|nr:hypothetical protein [Candidatus Paracaedibacter acanthamoebae]AIK97117.1 hypothetical protein ID47_10860 [Candidatus Paracaedibacter acanthamoebae]
MLTYFLKILITLGIINILTACTSQTPEDEKYGTIEGHFPRLVDVPDRPIPPSTTAIKDQSKALEQDKLDAHAQAKKNFGLATK